MSSEQPLPKQSEAQDGVRWMGGKEARGLPRALPPPPQAAPLRRRQRQQAVDPNAVPPPPQAAPLRRRRQQAVDPKRRAAESRGCGLLAGNYGRSSTARGRRSVPPPRCPPGTAAAAAASLGPNAVPPSSVAATVDGGPETAAAARRHVVLFKSPSVQQRRTTLPGLGACLQGPPVAGHTPPTPNMRPGGEGGPGCPGQSGPPSSKRRPVCVLNE